MSMLEEKYIEAVEALAQARKAYALLERRYQDDETVGKSSESKDLLFAALSKAQSQMKPAAKSSTNPHFNSSYSDIHEVFRAAREALSNNGLCILQRVFSRGGTLTVVTTLGHESGQWIEGSFTYKPLREGIQDYGSCITYMKRYAMAAMVGITSGDKDDDGEAEVRFHRAKDPAAPRKLSAALKSTQAAEVIHSPGKEERMPPSQLKALSDAIGDRSDLLDKLFEAYQIDRLADLPASQFQRVSESIRRNREAGPVEKRSQPQNV